ncbi:MAG: archease [Candidatus Omnitrophica bacterium]|nr:archease [Candidatus Omnitrophota bacterium]
MHKSYEIIEHTADIGIRCRSSNLKELFKNAALAMFDLIAEKPKSSFLQSFLNKLSPNKSEKIEVGVKGQDTEELFVNWLNELLSLSAAEGLIFYDFIIEKLDSNILEAVAIGNEFREYRVNKEIKAATYHELKVSQVKGAWQAEVIFDV